MPSYTPEQATRIAYEKRKQVFTDVNAELQTFNAHRERQIELTEDEKSKINILSFGIAGAVLSFSPSSMENLFVVIGMGILVINAIFFGILASWRQRKLNIRNFEGAMEDAQKIVAPYFDAYDEFIKNEPLDKNLWQKQHDALIEYLEKHKTMGQKPRIAKRHLLSIGEDYLWIFIAGFLLISFGLIQKYSFEGGDVTKVQLIQPIDYQQTYFRKMYRR